MTRFICEKCKLQYRYESDFIEHQNVGCRVESSNGATWSDKDDETELPAKVKAELIAEAPAEAKKKSKS